jgi:serine/threonine-protein kinase
MKQSLVTAPLIKDANKDSPDSTALNTSTGIRSNISTSLSQMNTGIKTVNRSDIQTRLKSSPSPQSNGTASPVAPRAASPGGGGHGGVALNISVKGSRNNRRGNETVNINQPVQWTTKEVLSAYEKGKRDFTDQDLQGLVFVKCFIPGINCYQSDLSRANFQNADLTRADFGKAILVQTSLKEANLSDAYFGYANLEGADLRGADLRGANFKYASVRGANFCGVDLSSTYISPEQLSLAKTNWRTVMPNAKRGMW